MEKYEAKFISGKLVNDMVNYIQYRLTIVNNELAKVQIKLDKLMTKAKELACKQTIMQLANISNLSQVVAIGEEIDKLTKEIAETEAYANPLYEEIDMLKKISIELNTDIV